MPRNSVGGPGVHSVICDVCGLKYKNHELSRRWDGAMVCKWDWEPRHPQEFVRAKKDNVVLPFIRPDLDDSIVYTPTWGLINALGNGTLVGSYTQRRNSADTADTITVTIRATIGSTTTFTAGNWTISFPVANGGFAVDGYAEALQKGIYTRGLVSLAASGTTANVKTIGDERLWSDILPKTWATDDTLFLSIRYGTNP